ncbi:MAG: hypothetical protein COA94_05120 [Rickettsiales bacterium]|nr:MAG: hypothetical protein COA94_05120 [Rickettsiales bacterium]
MAKIPVPLVGPTYTNRSLPVGAQVTRNFYVEVNQGGDEAVSMQPFPGLKEWGSAGDGFDRGLGVLNGILYKVSGDELYSVDRRGDAVLIGTILGSTRCTLVEDTAGNLVITTGHGKPYAYNGATLTLGKDGDLPKASTAAYINDRVIYESTTGLAFADLDTPLTVNSANILKANTKADGMMAVVAHRQQIFAFGAKSIEPNSFIGTGTPPYARVNNAVQQVGTSAKYSVSTNNNYIYFLDNNKQPSRMSGITIQAIGNPAIGQAIAKYSDVSDCFTVCFSFDNQDFCLFSFPTGDETWLFNEQSQLWTNLAFGVEDQHLISDYQFVYGKHLVSDRRNGNIYEIDMNTYTDNGLVIHRQRDTISISSKDLGPPGHKLFMNSLQLVIEPGASLVTVQATVMMQYSDDNGRTWSSERWADIGEQGDYTYHVEWLGLGSFYNRMFRFSMSDAINWVLISAHADVEMGLG